LRRTRKRGGRGKTGRTRGQREETRHGGTERKNVCEMEGKGGLTWGGTVTDMVL